MTRYSRKALVLQSVKFIDNSFFQILFFTKLDDWGFPGGTSGTEPACQCRRGKRCGFHPWAGKTPGGGPGNPLQYSCLENLMDRGAWWVTVHGVARVGHNLATKPPPPPPPPRDSCIHARGDIYKTITAELFVI